MKAILEIPVLLSALVIFCTFGEDHNATSSTPIPSIFATVNESLPQEVDTLNFFRRLLNLEDPEQFYEKMEKFNAEILDGSSNSTPTLDDVDFQTLIHVIKATREEVKAGENSMKSLNFILWLTTFDQKVGVEILNLVRMLQKTSKSVVFGMSDLAKEVAFRRLPRHRNQRRRRRHLESLLEEIEDVEIYLHLLDLELSALGVEKKWIQKIHVIVSHHLNEFYVEVRESHLSDVVVFLRVRLAMVMAEIQGVEKLEDVGNIEKKVEEKCHVIIEKAFGRALEVLAIQNQWEQTTKDVAPEDVTTPPRLLTEPEFLLAIRMLHVQVLPMLSRDFESPERIADVFNETCRNLTRILMLTVPSEPEFVANLTTTMSSITLKIREFHEAEMRRNIDAEFDGENVRFERVEEILQRGIEALIEVVRDAHRAQEKEHNDKQVLELVRHHLEELEPHHHHIKLAEQISWIREALGDYQFGLLPNNLEMFYNARILDSDSDSESDSESNNKIQIQNPSRLQKSLLVLREQLSLLLDIHPHSMFLPYLATFELDPLETRELFELLEPLVDVSKCSANMATLVRELANSNGGNGALEASNYKGREDWNRTLLQKSFERFSGLQKHLKSPRIFKRFLRSVGTLLANKVVFKKDWRGFVFHFYGVNHQEDPKIQKKTSEILLLLKGGARLLKAMSIEQALQKLELLEQLQLDIPHLQALQKMQQKVGKALPQLLRVYEPSSINTRALFTVSRAHYDKNISQIQQLLDDVASIDNATFLTTLKFLTNRPNPYANFSSRVAQALDELREGSAALNETFGIQITPNASFATTLHWYGRLVELVADDVALADWIATLHQVARSSSILEYTKELGKLLQSTGSWSRIQMAHEDIHELFGDEKVNRSKVLELVSQLDTPENLADVLLGYEQVLGAPRALREYFEDYKKDSMLLQKTLEHFGIHPTEYTYWNEATEQLDVIVDLLELAKTHQNLRRLLNSHNDFAKNTTELRNLVGYLELPKTEHSEAPISKIEKTPPTEFEEITKIDGKVAPSESIQMMWDSLVTRYGEDVVMKALETEHIATLLELITVLEKSSKS